MWIDDVWITGILAAKANLELKSLNSFYTFYKEHIQCCVKNRTLECDFVFGPSEKDSNVIREFGEHSINCWNFPHTAKNIERVCHKRNEKIAITKNCYVSNPYFLPDTRGIAEVF